MSENNDSGRSDGTRDSTSDTADRRSSMDSSLSSGTRHDSPTGQGADASNRAYTRAEWEKLHSDPDARADLGYEVTPWETIDTATDSEQVIFMPQNEALLKDDAFIVAEEDALRDLGKQY